MIAKANNVIAFIWFCCYHFVRSNVWVHLIATKCPGRLLAPQIVGSTVFTLNLRNFLFDVCTYSVTIRQKNY